MQYATLPMATALQLAPEFLSTGRRPLVEAEVVWTSKGPRIDLAPARGLSAEIPALISEFEESTDSDRDMLEGEVSGRLHSVLHELPVMTLDDPAFWRFLSFEFFWPLVMWREHKTFEAGEPGKYMKYLDGNNVTECVLTRMFLRGQISRQPDDDYGLATAVPEATDFWRSHILRVRTGSVPPLAKALIEEQAARRMSTDPLRAYARRLNRLGSNLVLPAIGDEQAVAIIEELREER